MENVKNLFTVKLDGEKVDVSDFDFDTQASFYFSDTGVTVMDGGKTGERRIMGNIEDGIIINKELADALDKNKCNDGNLYFGKTGDFYTQIF